MLSPLDLAACQQTQLDAMWDRCEIRYAPTTSLVGGVETTVEGAVAITWQGSQTIPCRVATAGGDITGVSLPTVGEQRIPTRHVMVTVPVGVVPAADRMVVKIVASTDPLWTGRTLPIVGVAGSTFPTARRLVCLAPEED